LSFYALRDGVPNKIYYCYLEIKRFGPLKILGWLRQWFIASFVAAKVQVYNS